MLLWERWLCGSSELSLLAQQDASLTGHLPSPFNAAYFSVHFEGILMYGFLASDL